MSWNPIDWITGLGKAVTEPVRDVMVKREDRKQAHQTLQTQSRMAEDANETTIEVEKTHLDAIMAGNLAGTWKDEFVTVAVVGIIPAIIVGGILYGFGFPLFLKGVLVGVTALKELIPLGNIMTVVVSAAVGIATWNRLKL